MGRLSGIGIGDWVTMNARRNPNQDCFVSPELSVTYGEVESRVNRLGRALTARGISAGDRISVLSTDSIAYLELLLASMKIGATAVPLNFRLSEPEIENLLKTSQPSAHFVSSRYSASLDSARRVSTGLRFTAALDTTTAADETLEGLIGSVADDSPLDAVVADEAVLCLALTSGTTGVPKGVQQSQRMLKTIIQSGVYELGLRPGDLLYSGAPLFHVSGMGHVLYGVLRGCASLILPQFHTATVLDWMQNRKVTHCMLVPSMVISLLAEPAVANHDYRDLRSIMYGGAPMPPSVVRRMIEVFDCDLYNGFGAGTEAGGQTMFRPEDHRRAMAGEEHLLGSIGRPVMGVDLRLIDEAGNDVPRGSVGEIATRSDSVMSGYLDQPDLTAKAVVDGWFRAGDLGWMDADGYIFLGGRSNDMIIRGGENVYPVEIEGVLAEMPGVEEVAVIGSPDTYWGEVVLAVVRTRADQRFTLETLQGHCRGRLAGYKIPEALVFVDEFPRNSTGKILKGDLRRDLLRGVTP